MLALVALITSLYVLAKGKGSAKGMRAWEFVWRGRGGLKVNRLYSKDQNPDADIVPSSILRERGFKKSRPKKYRNPRKHYRYKAAALAIKEKTSGSQFTKREPPPDNEYKGERTGIKASKTAERYSSDEKIDEFQTSLRETAGEYPQDTLPLIIRDGKITQNPLSPVKRKRRAYASQWYKKPITDSSNPQSEMSDITSDEGHAETHAIGPPGT
ncbi:hypothetical protein AAMO2058_001206300 [Amorphochlora amoebiformis]